MWLQSDNLLDDSTFRIIASLPEAERYEAEWFLFSLLARKAALAAERLKAGKPTDEKASNKP